MTLDDFILFANITTGTVLIPFGIGLFTYKKLSTEMKFLLLLAGISFLCDLASFASLGLKWNNYFVSLYVLIEFLVLVAIFYHALRNRKLLVPFVALSAGYFVFSVWYFIYYQKTDLNSYTILVSAFTFLALSVYYFYRLMVDMPTFQVYRLPMFWISVAVLIYFSANLFLFAMRQYLIHTMKDDMIVYWSFHNLITILRNILFAVAFYVNLIPREATLRQS